MNKLGIIQGQNIVETTVEFSRKRYEGMKVWMDCLKLKAKKLLNELSDFPGKETIETKNRLAIIQGQKIVEPNVGFSWKRKD